MEDRIFAGIRFHGLANLILEMQGGYAFNRFISENSDTRLTQWTGLDNSSNLGNSWYAATTARLTF